MRVRSSETGESSTQKVAMGTGPLPPVYFCEADSDDKYCNLIFK